MANQPPNMVVKPIGIVRSKVKQKTKPDYDWQKVVSEIVIDMLSIRSEKDYHPV